MSPAIAGTTVVKGTVLAVLFVVGPGRGDTGRTFR